MATGSFAGFLGVGGLWAVCTGILAGGVAWILAFSWIRGYATPTARSDAIPTPRAGSRDCLISSRRLAKEARLQGPSLTSIVQRFHNFEYFKIARKRGTG